MMRLFLYKLFCKLAVWSMPCKDRARLLHKYQVEQEKLYKRDNEMKACIRPKTYPKGLPKDARLPSYTDYYER